MTSRRFNVLAFAKSHRRCSSPGSGGPEAPSWAPKLVPSLWKAKEIFITENGCGTDDVLADDSWVYDTVRTMFLRAWSTMDNFEWNYGFRDRFGLVYVDFKTPKLSAVWFREAVRRNAVV